MIDRQAPGFAEAMRAEAVRHTPMGILTRGVSGIAGRSLIINFPGNPKAIGELFPVIAPTLEHVVATLQRERGQQNPRPLSCAGSPATSASGPRCARCRSRSRPAPRWPCSGATAPASRRCCGSSPRCCARTRGEVRVFGEPLPAPGLRGPRPARAARPRAAALPRADRPREPRIPRPPAPGRARARGGGARGGADGAPGRRPGPAAVARDGPAPGRRPRRAAPARSCCCSTSRGPTSTRPPSELVEPLIGRASGAHPGADQPRPRARRWPRPTSCWRSRTAGRRTSASPAGSASRSSKELYA